MAYSRKRAPELAEQVREFGRTSYRIRIGHDESFEEDILIRMPEFLMKSFQN